MDDEILIYRLLARALLDIRIAAVEGRNEATFEISNVFHNVPFQLARIRSEGGDFHEILDWLEMRCGESKMKGWLANALEECAQERSNGGSAVDAQADL